MPVIGHRLILGYEAGLSGTTASALVEGLLGSVGELAA